MRTGRGSSPDRLRGACPGAPVVRTGFDRRAGVVAAVHPLQVAVEERLDAYAEAVGPFAAQGCEVGEGEVIGVRLDGHLFQRRIGPLFPHLPDKVPQFMWREQARRAAAAENRLHLAALRPRRVVIQIA